jgi:CBS domain-containing protein
MLVADLIASRNDVYSVRDDATVHETALYLRERGVRAAGVLDASGKLVGAISQSDVSDKVAAENKCPAWMHVSEIMTPQLITVTPQTGLDACLRLMEEHSIYHLLVVDANERYLGMISLQDLLRVIASDEKARADLLEELIFPKR